MPLSKKPSSKVRYSAMFTGRRPTTLPYSTTDLHDEINKAVRDIVQPSPQLNDGVENVEHSRLEGSGSVAEATASSSSVLMHPVALWANRDRLKVKIDKDFILNGGQRDRVNRSQSSRRRWSGKMAGLATTLRYRMHNVLLVSRCTEPSLSRAVACVLWDGYDASTVSWLHLHVFWFVGHDGSGRAGSGSRESETILGNMAADMFVRHMSRYVDTQEHQERVRRLGADMVDRGQLDLRPAPSAVVSSRVVVPMRSFSAPHNSPSIDITQTIERPSLNVNHAEVGTVLKDDVDTGYHDVINGDIKTSGVSGDALSYVVDQRGRVRLTASNPAVSRSNFGNANVSSVNDGSRRDVLGNAQPQFTANGLPSDDEDCVALRSRIARLSQLVSTDNVGQQSGTYQPQESISPHDYDDTYPDLSTPENTGRMRQVPALIADELKLRLGSGAPILLPPKDYDTVNRHRGNLVGIEVRRCQQENVVGRASNASQIF